MKRNRHTGMLMAVMVVLLAAGASGCTVHARPAVVFDPSPVVVTVPPAQVYYAGHWLYYRSDAYYFYDGGAWLVAPSVPLYVRHYHRPAHVLRPVHVPGFYWPAPVHRVHSHRH